MKDPWLISTNCQTYHFDFLSSGPSFFYRTRVQSLFTLVADSLSNWRLTDSLLLLKLMMRSMLITVWCRFGRLTLVIKLSFFVRSLGIRFQGLFKILKLYRIGEQWLRATWKLNTFTHMLGSKTYVHLSWKGSINNDDMKDHHHHHFAFVTLWLFDGRRQ